MQKLLKEIRKCEICSDLPCGPRPIVTASPKSKVVIIGQAPGSVVHESGVPWDDKSGDNLRDWLGIDKQQFYDTKDFAIIPMGFCYPEEAKAVTSLLAKSAHLNGMIACLAK